MKVARTADELEAALRPARDAKRPVNFVPTMGALHEGHLSLVEAARSRAGIVVMSIFVNPLQFGPSEDLAAYPRDEDGDLAAAGEAGVEVVFLPTAEEMYPVGSTTTVAVGKLGELLEGAARPGHFDGVATVVAKLFNLVRPDTAFFGQKDAQQVAVIRRMTSDLSVPVELVVCPTVREHDGLAMSSRNAYLTTGERTQAGVLYRALTAGRDAFIDTGEVEAAEKKMWSILTAEEGVVVDYATAVDPESFEPARDGGPVLLVVAARLGTTRLIDNLPVR